MLNKMAAVVALLIVLATSAVPAYANIPWDRVQTPNDYAWDGPTNIAWDGVSHVLDDGVGDSPLVP